MTLRPPSRLPRQLKRAVTPLALSYAKKQQRLSGKMRRRTSERFSRFSRRWATTRTVIIAESRRWLIILSAACMLGLMGALLFSPVFNVKQIHVKRQDSRIDIDDVQRILSPLFTERLLFVTKGTVLSLLTSVYPDITDIAIKKLHPSTLSVSIFVDPIIAELRIVDESTASSGSTVPVKNNTLFHYVTKQGFIIVSPFRLIQQQPLPTIDVADWGIRPENRTKLTDDETLTAIFLARDTLRENFGLTPRSITLFLRAREFHLRTSSFTLMFDMTSSVQVQLGRFRELMKTVPLEQVKEYIDLRIADRVLYR